MTRKHWFLPETPDVLGMLRRQMTVTIDGADVFARWAGGDAAAAQAVRDAEDQGDVAKRDLLSALREAFVTPIEPEDLFALSRGIDRILNYVTALVEESEAMASPPDEGIATMAGLLSDALRHLDDALSKLGTDGDHATASADAAIAAQHQLETACYAGMVGLLSVEDRTERITAASCTAAPRGSAKPWSTSPSASSTPSSSRAEWAQSGSGIRRSAVVGSVGRGAQRVDS